MLLIYYILVNLIWGVGPIIDKYMMKYMDIITLMLIVSVIYLLAVIALAIRNRKLVIRDYNNMKNIENYKVLLLVLVIFSFSLTVANYGYLFAVNSENTALATILTSLYPIITLIIGYRFLKEKMTKLELCGFLLILCGIMLINYSKNLKDKKEIK